MAQTSMPVGPIPATKNDDTEDVAWALSTAEAMYARGDREDALKWLRRAAEAASESDADLRALELAKAVSNLASALGASTAPSSVAPARPEPSLTAPTPAPSASDEVLASGSIPSRPEEKTPIGLRAYEASAKKVTEGRDEPPPSPVEPSLRAMQAIRVVLWRGPDGVHVAPQGTRVSAITIDAMLVAMDPSADLAAWLTKK